MKHTKCYIPEYPRPQLVRRDWVNLNGEWNFAFGDEVSESEALEGKLPRNIKVPFAYETELSGINDTSQHNTVWYSRKICGKKGRRTILVFEGADYNTQVYVNGKIAGSHRGAYSRFSFDITDYLNDNDNILTVKCTDDDLSAQMRGKQRWEKDSYGCWYVQTTGIYKTVWLEYVNEVHLTKLKITPDISDNTVRFDIGVSLPAENVEVKIEISFDGRHIQTASVTAADIDNTISVRLDSRNVTYQSELWSVWNPALYDVEITVLKNGAVTDAAGSYFGLREYTVKDGKQLFNNAPFYAKLVLDQEYWKASGLTPPSEDAIIRDIQLAKEMGFNGCRKHQKNEDERFYYYADIMGFTVWCEMPSNYWYCDEASKAVTSEWLDIVTQNYSHPSLVTWVLFNESWGVKGIASNPSQSSLATGLYHLTKSIDTMRPVISNDGWSHAKSDILTLHNYEQDADMLYSIYDDTVRLTDGDVCNPQILPFANGYKYDGQPIIISEFGGIHYAQDDGWGYGESVHNDKEFLERFGSLMESVKKIHISGYCYTQLTDVEQETNGLLTAEREPKVSVSEISRRTAI